jgi:hypothetical protein
MQRCYYGPFGQAPRHLPYRRAALSFVRWQLQRGVLAPPFSDRPGSPWWRAVNERILRDGCEAVALSGDLPGPASSRAVDYWMSFAHYPTGGSAVTGPHARRAGPAGLQSWLQFAPARPSSRECPHAA